MERSIIDLWKEPANMGAKIGWSVFKQDRENDYSIREIRFFSLESWGRIQERVQTGEWDKSILEDNVRFGKLSQPKFDKQLELLRQIAIPLLVINDSSGYDGTFYGLEVFNSGFSRCKITWWEEGASEWKPLINWYRETETLLLNSLNASS